MNCEVAGGASGLAALYHFNQGVAFSNNAAETTLLDASGNNHNGTLTNFSLDGAYSNWVPYFGVTPGTSCPASPAGAALNFDGVDDYVQTNTDFDLGASDFTVEAWINPGILTSTGYIITNRTNETGGPGNWWNLQLQANNVVGFEMGADGSPSYTFLPGNTPIPSGQWSHIAVVRSGAHINIYVNGVLDADYEDDFVRNLTTGNNIGRLGGWPESNQGWFNGSIDEVRIWDVARTQTEIANARDCQPPIPNYPHLTRFYLFDQGTAWGSNAAETSLWDQSGGSNNGTLYNFALNGFSSNWVAPGGVTTGNICPALTPLL